MLFFFILFNYGSLGLIFSPFVLLLRSIVLLLFYHLRRHLPHFFLISSFTLLQEVLFITKFRIFIFSPGFKVKTLLFRKKVISDFSLNFLLLFIQFFRNLWKSSLRKNLFFYSYSKQFFFLLHYFGLLCPVQRKRVIMNAISIQLWRNFLH